jgi:hypothetical protein
LEILKPYTSSAGMLLHIIRNLGYIDGVLSLNSSKFGDNNPLEFDINDDIYTALSSLSFTYTSTFIVKKSN